jgi:hypothetical protein
MDSTSRSNQPGEALELIRYNVDTGKFLVGEQALAILRNIRTPLSVVAVCGRYVLPHLLVGWTLLHCVISISYSTACWSFAVPLKRL